MTNRLNIRQKILGLCVLIASSLLAVGAIGYFALDRVMMNYAEISDVILPSSHNLALMRAMGRENSAMVASLNMIGNTPEDVKRLRLRVGQSEKEFKKLFADFANGRMTAEDTARLPELQRLFEKHNLILDEQLAVFDSASADKSAQFATLFKSKGKDSRLEFFKELDQLISFQHEEMDNWRAKARAAAASARLWLCVCVLAGFIFALVTGFLVSSSLARVMVAVSRSLQRAAEQVSNDSERMFRSSEDLASSSNEQAAAIQETSASMHELSSIVSKNTENFQHALNSSEKNAKVVVEGRKVVQEVIQSMSDIEANNTQIQRQVNDGNQRISEIVQMINEIGAKTKIINDIVFQTKLLSFNASVEAARAGEHGKGFAVVAEEVGQLASNSGRASQEISGMLEQSIQKVERIVKESASRVDYLIGQASERIRDGAGIAARCGTVLDEIVRNVEEVSHISSEVGIASREQAKGVEEINRAISQLDRVTQINAGVASQASSTAHSLDNQAALLTEAVSQLSQIVLGKRPEARSTENAASSINSIQNSSPEAAESPLRRAG